MATEQKPHTTGSGPWFGDAMDEDVPAPMPTLLQERHERRPVGAWIAIATGVAIIGMMKRPRRKPRSGKRA